MYVINFGTLWHSWQFWQSGRESLSQEVVVKSPRLVFVLMFLALAFLIACGEKSGTPATTTNNANPGSSGAGASEDKGKKPATAEVTVIPSGTVIVVRLGETLSSK